LLFHWEDIEFRTFERKLRDDAAKAPALEHCEEYLRIDIDLFMSKFCVRVKPRLIS